MLSKLLDPKQWQALINQNFYQSWPKRRHTRQRVGMSMLDVGRNEWIELLQELHKHAHHAHQLTEPLMVDILLCKLLDNVHSVVLVCTSKDEVVVEIVISIDTVSATSLHKARDATYNE